MRRSSRRAPVVLGLIGEKSGGKSTVGAYLRKRRDIFFRRFSDVLNDLLVRLSLDVSDRSVQGRMGEVLRSGFGPQVIARAVSLDAKASRRRLVVVDGIRKPGELAYLRTHTTFRSVYVTAPPRVRFERAYHRNTRRDDRLTFAQFQRIERTYPSEVDIPRIGRTADYRIDNIGSRAELYRAVDRILADLLGRAPKPKSQRRKRP